MVPRVPLRLVALRVLCVCVMRRGVFILWVLGLCFLVCGVFGSAGFFCFCVVLLFGVGGWRVLIFCLWFGVLWFFCGAFGL